MPSFRTEPGENKVVRLAVIGAGSWGKNLVRNFNAIPGVELQYICDLDESVRNQMSLLYPGASITGDLDRILSDPALEGVVIAVDAAHHHSVASACLRAGKHTYVEKPLALSSAAWTRSAPSSPRPSTVES